MTPDEARKRYPELNDLSDEQLEEAIDDLMRLVAAIDILPVIESVHIKQSDQPLETHDQGDRARQVHKAMVSVDRPSHETTR